MDAILQISSPGKLEDNGNKKYRNMVNDKVFIHKVVIANMYFTTNIHCC